MSGADEHAVRRNKMPATVRRRYFDLIRQNVWGTEAARRVGVSLYCGALWFIGAGGVSIIETRPMSARYLSQADRIEIADGLAAWQAVKRSRDAPVSCSRASTARSPGT
jgi:transposase, IS30 family